MASRKQKVSGLVFCTHPDGERSAVPFSSMVSAAAINSGEYKDHITQALKDQGHKEPFEFILQDQLEAYMEKLTVDKMQIDERIAQARAVFEGPRPVVDRNSAKAEGYAEQWEIFEDIVTICNCVAGIDPENQDILLFARTLGTQLPAQSEQTLIRALKGPIHQDQSKSGYTLYNFIGLLDFLGVWQPVKKTIQVYAEEASRLANSAVDQDRRQKES